MTEKRMEDAMPPRPDGGQHHFPCPQCGADYRFSPATGEMICDHCGHVEDMDAPGPWGASIRELDFRAAINARLPEAEMVEARLAHCPNCGAEVEFEGSDHATDCPFCATPVVVGTGVERRIKPRGVLPFALTEEAAHKAMTDWLGRLWFAPNGLKQYARKGRKMEGIYVPYWTFDAQTRSRYTGARGTVYYVTRTLMRDGRPQTVRVAKVRWTPVSGQVQRFFDDTLVLASKALPQRYTDGLEPWDLAELRPYAPEYLAGFRAEAYQVPLEDGMEVARAKMDRVIERDVRFDIGGDRQQVHQVETGLSEVTFKHVLLPVWMAAYRYRGESYRFVVNGRTGRVQGERPWSKGKIALAVLAALVLLGLILLIGGQQ